LADGTRTAEGTYRTSAADVEATRAVDLTPLAESLKTPEPAPVPPLLAPVDALPADVWVDIELTRAPDFPYEPPAEDEVTRLEPPAEDEGGAPETREQAFPWVDSSSDEERTPAWFAPRLRR
jgi:hypothetical protein